MFIGVFSAFYAPEYKIKTANSRVLCVHHLSNHQDSVIYICVWRTFALCDNFLVGDMSILALHYNEWDQSNKMIYLHPGKHRICW